MNDAMSPGAQGDLLPALQIDDELALQGVDRLVRGERIRETLRLRAPQPDYQGRAPPPPSVRIQWTSPMASPPTTNGSKSSAVITERAYSAVLGSHHHSFFCRYESEILSRQMVSDSMLTISRFRHDELYLVAQIGKHLQTWMVLPSGGR